MVTKLTEIKNVIQQFETSSRRINMSNDAINRCVAEFVKVRGPVGTGKYACTCNNWGPRFIENSLDGCCPGCFQFALDHHQEMSVNGVKPVTMDMIENSTWGFNVAKIKENKALKSDEWMHRLVAAGNRSDDGANISWDILDWEPASRDEF